MGAGTGSNCLYFIEQLEQNQNWYLVEQNEGLKQATIRRFRDYANFHKYTFERKKDTLKITSLRKNIQVTIINGSLLDLEKLVDLRKVDLVIANAVFDLFSAVQIDQFVQVISKNKLSFYTTLNYQAMAFTPDDPFDSVFVEEYNKHMERPQAFGKALGKDAADYMVKLLDAAEGQVETANSSWQVGIDDIKMHYYLLNFMENALSEMDLEANMQVNFQSWIDRKKELIITRQQRLAINHLDILFAS